MKNEEEENDDDDDDDDDDDVVVKLLPLRKSGIGGNHAVILQGSELRF